MSQKAFNLTAGAIFAFAAAAHAMNPYPIVENISCGKDQVERGYHLMGSVCHRGDPISMVFPGYPESAKPNAGKTEIEFSVGPDGRVNSKVNVIHSIGHPNWDTAAVTALKLWRFPAAAGKNAETFKDGIIFFSPSPAGRGEVIEPHSNATNIIPGTLLQRGKAMFEKNDCARAGPYFQRILISYTESKEFAEAKTLNEKCEQSANK